MKKKEIKAKFRGGTVSKGRKITRWWAKNETGKEKKLTGGLKSSLWEIKASQGGTKWGNAVWESGQINRGPRANFQ